MRSLLNLFVLISLTFTSCHSEMSQKGKIIKEIDRQVAKIDHSHRMQIIEDDFISGDSLYKIRGYYSNKELRKVVGILKTPHFERDDYFYFEDEQPIFSGHMMNFMDDNLAEEFKFYFRNGDIVNTLMWKDHYVPGERFPHESFQHYDPDPDSLMAEEKDRVNYFLGLLDQKGIEIQQENENLEANH